MTKKDYLLRVLQILDQDTLPIKEPLQLLLSQDQVPDELIEVFVTIFAEAIKTTNDEVKKAQLKKGIHILEQLKAKEAQQKASEQASLANIEELIDAL
ncbi:MAG: hypothetical protein Q4B28_04035 [bacterium]|nr:hypothetical protein [bacterium]